MLLMDDLTRPFERIWTFRSVVTLLVFFIADASAQRIVEQTVEPSDAVTVGDRMTLVLTVETPDDAEPQPAIPDERGNERAWGLPTVERGKRLSATTTRWTVRVPFQVFRVGEVAVPSLDLAVGGTVLTSDPATVVVRTVREGDDANDLRDVRPPVPLTGFPWSWIVALGGVFVALVWLRRGRPGREASTAEQRPLPDEWLEAEFARLEAMPVGDAESLRRFVAAAADTVRGYLERKAGIPAPSRTTRRTLDAVAPILTRETHYRLEEILRAADYVKFAGHAPAAEVARLYLQRVRETVATVADELARRVAQNEIAS
jgi:hypothetical protein